MKYLINGDLYVRIIPDIIPKIEPISNILGKIRNVKTNKTYDLNDVAALSKLPIETLRELASQKLIKLYEYLDKDNLGLFQLSVQPDTLILWNKRSSIYYQENIENLYINYIRLETFIQKSLYIGRNFFSSNPSKPKYEILYEYSSIYLLVDINTRKYVLLNKNSEFLSDYKIGEVQTDYYEKEALYQDIIKQEFHIEKNDRYL